MTDTLALRIAALRAEIDAAALAAGRDPASVRLLAASKTIGPEALFEALATGQRLYGENRAQELRDKQAWLAAAPPVPPPSVEWHFIGKLQKNKVRNVVGAVSLIHTVDSLDLAQEIARRRRNLAERGEDPGPVGVLVEVNVGDEETKAGVPAHEALALAAALQALPDLSLRGLMCIPPWREDPEEMAPAFAQMAALAAEGRDRGLSLHELSMGMSDDFSVAIRYGATLVRVGTRIFGPRA